MLDAREQLELIGFLITLEDRYGPPSRLCIEGMIYLAAREEERF